MMVLRLCIIPTDVMPYIRCFSALEFFLVTGELHTPVCKPGLHCVVPGILVRVLSHNRVFIHGTAKITGQADAAKLMQW